MNGTEISVPYELCFSIAKETRVAALGLGYVEVMKVSRDKSLVYPFLRSVLTQHFRGGNL